MKQTTPPSFSRPKKGGNDTISGAAPRRTRSTKFQKNRFSRDDVIAFHARRAVAATMQAWDVNVAKTFHELLKASVCTYNQKLLEFLTQSGKDTSRVPKDHMYASLSVKKCFETDSVINMALISEDPYVKVHALPALRQVLKEHPTARFAEVLQKYIQALTPVSSCSRSVRHTFSAREKVAVSTSEEEKKEEGWSTVSYRRKPKQRNRLPTFIFPSLEAKASFLYHTDLISLWSTLPGAPRWNVPLHV